MRREDLRRADVWASFSIYPDRNAKALFKLSHKIGNVVLAHASLKKLIPNRLADGFWPERLYQPDMTS